MTKTAKNRKGEEELASQLGDYEKRPQQVAVCKESVFSPISYHVISAYLRTFTAF